MPQIRRLNILNQMSQILSKIRPVIVPIYMTTDRPIYDENGNIVGVVISQLNKRKFEKIMGSMPESVNFGIKASTVRQFLTASGLPTKWSKRSKRMSTKQLAKIAKNQTVMVVCHP